MSVGRNERAGGGRCIIVGTGRERSSFQEGKVKLSGFSEPAVETVLVLFFRSYRKEQLIKSLSV
jgi:hypothetical protein